MIKIKTAHCGKLTHTMSFQSTKERIRKGEILPPPKLDQKTIKEFERLSSIKKDMKTGEAMNVLTDISSNTSYKTSWIMEKLMERLEKEGGGYFSYRMHYDKYLDDRAWKSSTKSPWKSGIF